MDAWIEIWNRSSHEELDQSHPLWMRGLKLDNIQSSAHYKYVASFMDAWIEMMKSVAIFLSSSVASFMDAWIEIFQTGYSQ